MSLLDDHIITLAAGIGNLLRPRGLRLVTAESCTGGGLAYAITEPALRATLSHKWERRIRRMLITA